MKRLFRHRFLIAAFLFLLALIFIPLYTLPLPGYIPVLMYHFVGSKQDAEQSNNFVSRQSLAAQMSFLKQFGFRVISMEDYYDILKKRRKPLGREIVLTFDDGNYSFDSQAFPILKLYGYPSTVFLISENIRQEINGSMDLETIKKLLATGLVTPGAHTKTHPFLSKMTGEQIEEELVGSKKDLEEMLGLPVYYVSYPFGDMDDRVVETAEKAGYLLGFTTSYKRLIGLKKTGDLTLTRVKIAKSSDNLMWFWFKLSGIYSYFKSKSNHQ